MSQRAKRFYRDYGDGAISEFYTKAFVDYHDIYEYVEQHPDKNVEEIAFGQGTYPYIAIVWDKDANKPEIGELLEHLGPEFTVCCSLHSFDTPTIHVSKEDCLYKGWHQ